MCTCAATPPGWPAMLTRRCVASSPSRAVEAPTARPLTYTRCLQNGAMYGMSTEHCRRKPLRAIILAGGASTRLGADKPEQLVGGRRLLDIAVTAVADADAVVVVGPPREVPTGVTVVREDPPGRGPVDAPVALAVDDDGRLQYLTAVWDSAALATALTASPSRMRDLLPDNVISIHIADITDVDTPEQ